MIRVRSFPFLTNGIQFKIGWEHKQIGTWRNLVEGKRFSGRKIYPSQTQEAPPYRILYWDDRWMRDLDRRGLSTGWFITAPRQVSFILNLPQTTTYRFAGFHASIIMQHLPCRVRRFEDDGLWGSTLSFLSSILFSSLVIRFDNLQMTRIPYKGKF